jgi:hypothetical protein
MSRFRAQRLHIADNELTPKTVINHYPMAFNLLTGKIKSGREWVLNET